MVGNAETYENVSAWETVGNDALAKKIIESDEFTTREKLDLIRALDGGKNNTPVMPYIQPQVIYHTRYSDDGCEERRYKLTC